jgi:hypothetical protein
LRPEVDRDAVDVHPVGSLRAGPVGGPPAACAGPAEPYGYPDRCLPPWSDVPAERDIGPEDQTSQHPDGPGYPHPACRIRLCAGRRRRISPDFLRYLLHGVVWGGMSGYVVTETRAASRGCGLAEFHRRSLRSVCRLWIRSASGAQATLVSPASQAPEISCPGRDSTDPMEHRCGYSRPDGTSVRLRRYQPTALASATAQRNRPVPGPASWTASCRTTRPVSGAAKQTGLATGAVHWPMRSGPPRMNDP